MKKKTEKKLRNYYIVGHGNEINKSVQLDTISFTRNESIALFMHGMDCKWAKARSWGWRCHKVNIVISQAKNSTTK
jgi:hypothetical protein